MKRERAFNQSGSVADKEILFHLRIFFSHPLSSTLVGGVVSVP
jgi:hypothetical protein